MASTPAGLKTKGMMIEVILRWTVRAVVIGLLVWIATCLAVLALGRAAWDQHGAGRSLGKTVDAAIVLGGGFDGDGTIGYSTRRRVAAAVEALQGGRVRHLIFSGAPMGRTEDVTAARLMADHARQLGAPPGSLFLEPRATTTFENLRFGLALARDHGFESVAIVTDSFHLPRAAALAAYFGAADIGQIAAPGLEFDSPGNRLFSILREGLAWWYNLYKVIGWEALSLLALDPAERQDLIR